MEFVNNDCALHCELRFFEVIKLICETDISTIG